MCPGAPGPGLRHYCKNSGHQRIYPRPKFMCPGAPGTGLGPDCKKSLYQRMDPRPKLSPPQSCAALIDPREPYKLTLATWTGEFSFPGKMAGV
ncbi:hypothetical protein RLOC_00013236, partial [Lonchura striata]